MDIKEARQMYNDGFRADGLAEYAEQNNMTDDQVEEMATWLRKAEFEVHADEVTKQVQLLNEELIAITGDEEAWTDVSSNEIFTIFFGGNSIVGRAKWIWGETIITKEEMERIREKQKEDLEKQKKEVRQELIDELMEEIRRKMA